MTNRVSRGLPAAIVVMLVAAAGPFASPAEGQARQRGGPRNPDALPGVAPAEIQRMLDGYELLQAQEMLQLGDDQFPRFLPRLRALQDARRRAQMQRFRTMQDLRRMTQAREPQEEAALRDGIKALDDLDARSAEEIKKARQALDEVLNPYQQARFRIFEEVMQQRKVELLMRARQANRQNRQQNQFAP